MVVDVARTAIVWDRWTGPYGDLAAGWGIQLAAVHHHSVRTLTREAPAIRRHRSKPAVK